MPSFAPNSLAAPLGATSSVNEYWRITLGDASLSDVGEHTVQIDCQLVAWPASTYTGVTEFN